ncbi:hypothetical protein [Paenibacillus periandrae]|uniref:hypothetical protein n=1 Tax=Paenibacillus periandrae TaxID=1761741 RepID=UPI001F094F6D|nr:hypothetical protein [Paenibacillus periandrae]
MREHDKTLGESLGWMEKQMRIYEVIENACNKHGVKMNDNQKSHIVRYIGENQQLDMIKEVDSLVKTVKESQDQTK